MKKDTLPHEVVCKKTGHARPLSGDGAGKATLFWSGRFPTLDEAETCLVKEAMRASGGNKTKAAELLGITRFALGRKLGTRE